MSQFVSAAGGLMIALAACHGMAVAQECTVHESQRIIAPDGEGGDAFATVAIGERWAAVGASRDDDGGYDAGAVYLYFRQQEPGPDTWHFSQKLVPLDAHAAMRFGTALALDDTTLAIGAPDDTTTCGEFFHQCGSVYVYDLDDRGTPEPQDDEWVINTKLRPVELQPNDDFGAALEMYGNRIVVTAPGTHDPCDDCSNGAAYVYQRDNLNDWYREAKLVVSKDVSHLMGLRVAMTDGWIAVTGGEVAGPDGVVLYREGNLLPSGLSEWVQHDAVFFVPGFGSDLAMTPTELFVGASHDDSPCDFEDECNYGSVSHYIRLDGGTTELDDDVWNLEQVLYADDGQEGDRFGAGVAIWNDLLVVGANKREINCKSPGVCRPGVGYLFERGIDESGGVNWNEIAKIEPSDANDNEIGLSFGFRVAVNAGVALFGAIGWQAPGSEELLQGAAYFVSVGALVSDLDGDGTVDGCDSDADGDDIPNYVDACPFAATNGGVDETGRPVADLNGDCVVDLEDLVLFQRGFTGPVRDGY